MFKNLQKKVKSNILWALTVSGAVLAIYTLIVAWSIGSWFVGFLLVPIIGCVVFISGQAADMSDMS